MLMNDLSIIVRHMRVYAERSLADTGLGFPEQLVIMCLAGRETSNQEHIARFLEIDKGAVAKTVAKLEAKGLVESKVNEQNRREKTLSLSPAAQPVIERMAEALAAWQDAMHAGIDPDDQRVFEACAARMAQNSNELLREAN